MGDHGGHVVGQRQDPAEIHQEHHARQPGGVCDATGQQHHGQRDAEAADEDHRQAPDPPAEQARQAGTGQPAQQPEADGPAHLGGIQPLFTGQPVDEAPHRVDGKLQAEHAQQRGDADGCRAAGSRAAQHRLANLQLARQHATRPPRQREPAGDHPQGNPASEVLGQLRNDGRHQREDQGLRQQQQAKGAVRPRHLPQGEHRLGIERTGSHSGQQPQRQQRPQGVGQAGSGVEQHQGSRHGLASQAIAQARGEQRNQQRADHRAAHFHGDQGALLGQREAEAFGHQADEDRLDAHHQDGDGGHEDAGRAGGSRVMRDHGVES